MIDWHGIIAHYGAFGLGFGAFVSATLVPLSSEALLLGGVAAGIPAATAFAWSSAGNCLGCALNYALGAWLRNALTDKMRASKSGQTALRWMEHYGAWSLWASWLPFVGDPLTLLAGAARANLAGFAAIVFSLRIARYALTLYGASFFPALFG